MKYCKNSKYWDTFSTYHTCPKILNSPFYYLLMCLINCCMKYKQCRPWSDTTFCSIWSGSTLFAKANLSKNIFIRVHDCLLQPCTNPHQIQIRRRSVLRDPILSPGNNCPRLLEERLCIKGENCVDYRWQMSEWTSCLVNSGLVECGMGHRQRYAVCRDHNNQVVENTLCKEVHIHYNLFITWLL